MKKILFNNNSNINCYKPTGTSQYSGMEIISNIRYLYDADSLLNTDVHGPRMYKNELLQLALV